MYDRLIRWKDGKAWIGGRQIVLPDKTHGHPQMPRVTEVINKAYTEAQVPANSGIRRLTDYMQQRYIGVARRDIASYLSKQAGYNLFPGELKEPSNSRAQVIKRVGASQVGD